MKERSPMRQSSDTMVVVHKAGLEQTPPKQTNFEFVKKHSREECEIQVSWKAELSYSPLSCLFRPDIIGDDDRQFGATLSLRLNHLFGARFVCVLQGSL